MNQGHNQPPVEQFSEERAERAMNFLATTDEEIGRAIANRERAERMLKATVALAMKGSGEKSAAAQEREALASSEYAAATDEIFEAVKAVEVLKARRASAQTVIDGWRTKEASRRRA